MINIGTVSSNEAVSQSGKVGKAKSEKLSETDPVDATEKVTKEKREKKKSQDNEEQKAAAENVHPTKEEEPATYDSHGQQHPEGHIDLKA